MKQDRTYIMYFEDILLSITRIFEYTQKYNFIHFKQDYKTVDAVIRNFEIIGEAAKNLPAEIKEQYPDVPWNEMYSLRNRISHAYFCPFVFINALPASSPLPHNLRPRELEVELHSPFLLQQFF